MEIHKKRLLNSFIILTIITFMILACKREEAIPPEPTIYGSWVRLITDSLGIQFNAELKMNSDNSFDFILIDSVPGHTNSSAEFTLNGNTITIINDSDCNVDGEYEYVVTDKKLAFIAVDDECGPRLKALQGVWTKK